MNYFVRIAALLLGTSLAACGDAPVTEPAEPVQAQPAETPARAQITEASQGVLTDAQRDGLNAANQASALLQQADAARRKQLEEQTR